MGTNKNITSTLKVTAHQA